MGKKKGDALRYADQELIGISLCDEYVNIYVNLYNNKERDEVLGYIKKHLKPELYVMANASFDLAGLNKYGLYTGKESVWDICTSDHLINENNIGKHGLKAQAQRYLGVTPKDYDSNLSPNSKEFVQYALNDSLWTLQIYKHHLPLLYKQGLVGLMKRVEMPYVHCLTQMRITGVTVDWELNEEYKNKAKTLTNDLLIKLCEHSETKYSMQANLLTQELSVETEVNFNSGEQVSQIIINKLGIPLNDKTEKGSVKVDKHTLKKHADKHLFIKYLLEYKALQKLRTAFLSPLKGFSEGDGKIRPNFMNWGTVTGRLSSSRINAQQLPNSSDDADIQVRKQFTAPPGYKMFTADYSGFELRIMSSISEDDTMIKVLNEGGDLHQSTADLMNVDRKTGKIFNFSVAYGKAQTLDSKILTPNGFTTFKDIREDQEVFTYDGSITKVTKVHPIHKQKIYKVTMMDGSSTKCSENHLWTIQTCYDKSLKRYRTVETKEMKKMLRSGNQNNCFIDYVEPLQFTQKEQIINPYIIGLYLSDGSGCSIITKKSEKIRNKVEKLLPKDLILVRAGKNIRFKSTLQHRRNDKGQFLEHNLFRRYLIKLGLKGKIANNKFIPKNYLYGSISQRQKLLNGLIDGDGSKNNNSFEYTTVSKQLKDDIIFLVKSLGGRCSFSKRYTFYTHKGIKKRGQQSYRLFISFPPYRKSNSVKNVEYIGDYDCRCISVKHESGLYITDDFMITHNSKTGFSEDLGVNEDEAEKLIDKFNKAYPKVYKEIKSTHLFLERTGFVKNVFGRRRRLPPLKGERGDYYQPNRHKRQSFNFRIQSSAGDILRHASNIVYKHATRQPEMGLKLVMTVHDENVYIVKKSYLEKGMRLVKTCFEKSIKDKVRFLSDVKHGDNYQEAK